MDDKSVFEQMDNSGLRVDLESLKILRENYLQKMNSILENNGVSSVKELKGRVEKFLVTKFPQVRKFSLSKQALSVFNSQLCGSYLEAVSYQRTASILTSCEEKVLNGRIYFTHKLHEYTGRVYVGGFNYTNLPKDCRSIILPDENQVFVELDVCATESVVLAVLSGDSTLLYR